MKRTVIGGACFRAGGEYNGAQQCGDRPSHVGYLLEARVSDASLPISSRPVFWRALFWVLVFLAPAFSAALIFSRVASSPARLFWRVLSWQALFLPVPIFSPVRTWLPPFSPPA